MYLLGHFNIQREMIIRTEESRKLGAKYLDFAEMGSREECLRLCCETDECDVFVYEEKVLGQLYIYWKLYHIKIIRLFIHLLRVLVHVFYSIVGPRKTFVANL